MTPPSVDPHFGVPTVAPAAEGPTAYCPDCGWCVPTETRGNVHKVKRHWRHIVCPDRDVDGEPKDKPAEQPLSDKPTVAPAVVSRALDPVDAAYQRQRELPAGFSMNYSKMTTVGQDLGSTAPKPQADTAGGDAESERTSVPGVKRSAEGQARDILERMGVADAEMYSSGDLVEIANLIAERRALRNELETVKRERDLLRAFHACFDRRAENLQFVCVIESINSAWLIQKWEAAKGGEA